MKNKVVIIDENKGARLLINPAPEEYVDKKHMVNPDMHHMLKIPMEHWDIEDNKLVVKHRYEIHEISKTIPKQDAIAPDLSHFVHKKDMETALLRIPKCNHKDIDVTAFVEKDKLAVVSDQLYELQSEIDKHENEISLLQNSSFTSQSVCQCHELLNDITILHKQINIMKLVLALTSIIALIAIIIK
jgi:hypothetical protein